MKYPVFLYTAIALLAVSCAQATPDTLPVQEEAPAAIQAATGSLPGRIRIKLKHEIADTKAAGLDLSALGNYTMVRTFPEAGKWEARHRAAGLHLWYDLIFDESLPLTKAGNALLNQDLIDIVEFVPEIKAQSEPYYPFNDPGLPTQWHYQNFGNGDQYAEGCDVNAFKAWTIETGNPEVIVAINDVGVDYTHEDLAANMWINEAEFNGLPGEDDDNNGYVDDIYGYNFITYDGKTAVGKIDPGDHGTHVAGTVAAVNNNGIGVGGVAGGNGTPDSGVRLMVTQMMNEKKNGSLTEASIVYAADNGAVLMNCSWGNTNNEAPTSKALKEAIDYFNANAGMDENGNQVGPMKGGLIIFAAGNDGREVEHPAMDDNVFAVAALSANYVRSYFTSFGEWVDICAPGGDANRKTYVYSTLPDNQYGNMQGSSMAAPHVTGVAALLVSYYGAGKKGFTRDKLIYLLQSTANKKALEENGSYATKLGAGLVDAYAALTAEKDQEPLPVSVLKGASQANTITVEWTVPGSAEVRAPYQFSVYYGKQSLKNLDPKDLPEGVNCIKVLSYGRAAGETLSATVDALSFDTDYYFRIQSESLTGLTAKLSPEIKVRTGHNSTPEVTPLDGTSLTLNAFQTGSLRFKVSDPDGQPLSISCTEMMGLSVTINEDLVTLTMNALKTDPGTYEGEISVSDSYAETKQAFSFKVLENKEPVVIGSIGDQIFNGTSENRSFDLSRYFSDGDGETLDYSVESSSSSIIVKTAIENGTLSLTAHSYGQTTLTVTAKDARGATARQSFRVLVRNGSVPVEAYPNPVKDYLNIRTSDTATANVKLISSLGAVCFTGSLPVSPFEPAKIDCQSYSAGIYTLVVELGSSEYRYTIVKQ